MRRVLVVVLIALLAGGLTGVGAGGWVNAAEDDAAHAARIYNTARRIEPLSRVRVKLRDGRVLLGRLMEATPDEIRILVSVQELSYPMAEVAEVGRDRSEVGGLGRGTIAAIAVAAAGLVVVCASYKPPSDAPQSGPN
jgi:small nuclear ribonucleoprotein (snRNP)-like protein